MRISDLLYENDYPLDDRLRMIEIMHAPSLLIGYDDDRTIDKVQRTGVVP
ncbi:MAG: hypothetical protein IH892_02510 [Planctomycetes bacterium]|nr:hypothetical protein [Planctomycetota bacterium]